MTKDYISDNLKFIIETLKFILKIRYLYNSINIYNLKFIVKWIFNLLIRTHFSNNNSIV